MLPVRSSRQGRNAAVDTLSERALNATGQPFYEGPSFADALNATSSVCERKRETPALIAHPRRIQFAHGSLRTFPCARPDEGAALC